MDKIRPLNDYKTIDVDDLSKSATLPATDIVKDSDVNSYDDVDSAGNADIVVTSQDHDMMMREDDKKNIVTKRIRTDREVTKARRVKQLQMRFAGYRPTTEIYPVLAEEFNCSTELVHWDWTHRDKWIAEAAKLADVDSIMAETKVTGDITQNRIREATKSIWDEMNRHKGKEGEIDWTDPVVPLLYGFLKDYLKETMAITAQQVKNLTKLGVLKEEPKRVQVEEKSLNVNINAFDVLDEGDRMKLFSALFNGGSNETD